MIMVVVLTTVRVEAMAVVTMVVVVVGVVMAFPMRADYAATGPQFTQLGNGPQPQLKELLGSETLST